MAFALPRTLRNAPLRNAREPFHLFSVSRRLPIATGHETTKPSRSENFLGCTSLLACDLRESKKVEKKKIELLIDNSVTFASVHSVMRCAHTVQPYRRCLLLPREPILGECLQGKSKRAIAPTCVPARTFIQHSSVRFFFRPAG